MGALVEIFCSVFEIVAHVSEKQNPNMGCLGMVVVLILSAAISLGLAQVVFWLAR